MNHFLTCSACKKTDRIYTGLCSNCLLHQSKIACKQFMDSLDQLIPGINTLQEEVQQILQNKISQHNIWIDGYQSWHCQYTKRLNNQYDEINRVCREIQSQQKRRLETAEMIAHLESVSNVTSQIPNLTWKDLELRIQTLRQTNVKYENQIAQHDQIFLQLPQLGLKITASDRSLIVMLASSDYHFQLKEGKIVQVPGDQRLDGLVKRLEQKGNVIQFLLQLKSR